MGKARGLPAGGTTAMWRASCIPKKKDAVTHAYEALPTWPVEKSTIYMLN